MTGIYAQSEIEWTRTLRTTLGLRADVYRYAVTSSNAAQLRATAPTGLVSPKFAAVFGPWAGTEFYANAGMGFHSNDARGAVTRSIRRRAIRRAASRRSSARRARRSACARFACVACSPRCRSGTSGSIRSCCSSATPGTTEPGRPSRRDGVEWTNYCAPAALADRRRRRLVLAGAVRRRRPGGPTHSRRARPRDRRRA